MIFPNVTVNLHPEGAQVLCFRPDPTDSEKVTFDLIFLVHPVDDPGHKLLAYMGLADDVNYTGKTRPSRSHVEPRDPKVGDEVVIQDYDNAVCVQNQMKSEVFKGLRLSEQEQRVRHYHMNVERYMSGQRPQADVGITH